MAIKRQYTFDIKGIKVTTPVAETLFMCLKDVNEYTGKYGGKLVFDESALNARVPVTVNKVTVTQGFKETIDDLLADALNEYQKNTGKKATAVSLFKENKDKEGNDTGKLEFTAKSFEPTIVVTADKVKIPQTQIPLLSNGSTVKMQLNIVPYFMNGNVGLTCYINAVQLLNVIEYGGGSDNSGFSVEDGYTAVISDDADEIQF